MPKNYFQHGFTLIEILITIAIVGVISMIAANSYDGYIDTTKNSLAATHIKSLSLLIDDFYLDNGYYPSNLNDIDNADLVDPWGKTYTYLNFNNSQTSEGHHHGNTISSARKDRNLVPINSNYDLYSFGKDGKSKPPLTANDSHDDIIYANDGAYIGIAKLF